MFPIYSMEENVERNSLQCLHRFNINKHCNLRIFFSHQMDTWSKH